METVDNKSILIVVSHDFGELAYAYDFISSLHESYKISIALPEHIFQSNRGVLSVPILQYDSHADITTLYEKLSPDFVLLFSAYLLVPNKVFSLRSLRKFIERIQSDEKVLISSDPFLGMTGSFRVDDVNLTRVNPSSNRFRQYLFSWLTCLQFRKIHRILNSVPRLVPFGVDGLHAADERPEGYFSYFNEDLQSVSATKSEPAVWLFVISELDYFLQKENIGEEKYVELLVDKLTETRALDRKPVLLAPLGLIDKVRLLLSEIECYNQCNVIEHRKLILDAERVFYWNMISHSIYHRITRYKPLHFFDRGHVYEMFPRLHARAMGSYYQGAEPAMIDSASPLNIDVLESDSDNFYAARRGGLEQLRDLPSSDALLRQLSLPSF